MLKSLTRASAALLVAVSFGIYAVPANADGNGEALATGVVSGANIAIKNAMDAHKQQSQPLTKRADGQSTTIEQVPPINQQPVGSQPQQQGLPTGLTYFADASIAKPYGDIGSKTNWLKGGIDAMAAYGFDPTTRLVASYYELQHYPYGFNSGTVNTYLPPAFPLAPGINPSPTNLAAQNLDLSTKDKFLLLSVEKLFVIPLKDRALPIVVTPTYVARYSEINQSGNNSDVVPFVNQQTGAPITDVNTRTAQYDSVAFTIPFLKTPRMFGTFTVAPTWLVHLSGVNQENHAQLYQILYLEYNATKTLRFFLEPQSSRDYLPTDYYAQHLNAYFAGVTQRVGKYGFIQAVLNSGGPSNYSPYGVKYFQCYALPCGPNTVPAIGGLKATQLQLQFGVGSPVVLPF
jgi:hypothetical protein